MQNHLAFYWMKGISSHGTRRHSCPRGRHQLSVSADIYGKMAPDMYLANVVISSIWKLLQLLLPLPLISSKCEQLKYHLLQSGTFPLTSSYQINLKILHWQIVRSHENDWYWRVLHYIQNQQNSRLKFWNLRSYIRKFK